MLWDLNFVKQTNFKATKTAIIQTSLHDDMILGLGVGCDWGIQVWLHLSSLGFTIEMCMCIYTQSSIKLCKASLEGVGVPSVLDCFVRRHTNLSQLKTDFTVSGHVTTVGV